MTEDKYNKIIAKHDEYLAQKKEKREVKFMSADGKTELPVMSDFDFKVKMAVKAELDKRGISTRQEGELAANIFVGLLAVVGVVFVIGLCLILRDGRPFYGYYRRYWW